MLEMVKRLIHRFLVQSRGSSDWSITDCPYFSKYTDTKLSVYLPLLCTFPLKSPKELCNTLGCCHCIDSLTSYLHRKQSDLHTKDSFYQYFMLFGY